MIILFGGRPLEDEIYWHALDGYYGYSPSQTLSWVM